MHGDPTVVVAKVDVDTAVAAYTSPPPRSLRAMMETVMATQATHGQLLDGLLVEVAALRVDLADYRHPTPPSPPFDS